MSPAPPATNERPVAGDVVEELSCGDPEGTGYIIQRDNAEVMQAMRERGEGGVRCVYMDPPYNNQEVYEHYEDDASPEAWMEGIEKRIALAYDLLSETGSLWISIDDRQVHYLKVACDRLLGRDRFVATLVWNHRKTRENRSTFSFNHEYLLVYAKDRDAFGAERNQIPLNDKVLKRYKNRDDDPRGPWQSVSANVQAGHAVDSQFYEIVAPNGKRHRPPQGRCWAYNEERMKREIEQGNIWFGQDGNGVPRIKKFLSEADKGLTPHTMWKADKVGTTRSAKKHILELFPEQPPFDTPKPEKLIARILRIATNPGDLVLDPYLGSGTTAAVAHKMGRRYIGIERGAHAASLCAKRIEAVVGGESGGISGEVGWKGGGGAKFLKSSKAASDARR